NVLAQLPVEHELITCRLSHLRCGGQLIEKEDALTPGWQELRRNPFGRVGRDARQTAEVDGIELEGANIEKLGFKVVRDLVSDLGFTDTAWAPDMHGHTLGDQRMQRFVKHGWFHGLSFG